MSSETLYFLPVLSIAAVYKISKHPGFKSKIDLLCNIISSGNERQKKKVDIIESCGRYMEILHKLR